jgi:hypothetical protein
LEAENLPNLRIIYDNAADRAALTGSSAAGSMTVDRMLTDIKADVWRSTGPTATITATWTKAETIGGIALPFCNLSALATLRARGYSAPTDAVPLFDTGAIYACPGPALGLWNWGAAALGSNAFAYGGGTYGRLWIPVPGAVRKLVIDIDDSTNPAGYIEVSRLVCGGYWEPSENADYGAPATPVDTSKHYRNDAGDLLTDAGTRHRKQSVSLAGMSAVDRAVFWSILLGNGMPRPVFFSLYPNHEDAKLEQERQIYGKLFAPAALTTPSFQRYASSLDLEEI